MENSLCTCSLNSLRTPPHSVVLNGSYDIAVVLNYMCCVLCKLGGYYIIS